MSVVGLALIPVSFGIVARIGGGIAGVGGATAAIAGSTEFVIEVTKRRKAKKILEDHCQCQKVKKLWSDYGAAIAEITNKVEHI